MSEVLFAIIPQLDQRNTVHTVKKMLLLDCIFLFPAAGC